MGLFDKASSGTKSLFGGSGTKINEAGEVKRLEKMIADEREKVKETYELIGKEYYRYTVDGDGAHEEAINKYVDQINNSRKLITEYELEIDDVRQRAKEERENLKAAAELKQKEKEEEEEALRQEKKRIEKEKDDLF
jgi:hypothetical protein